MQDTSDRLQRAMAALRDEQTLRTRLDEIVRRKGLQDVCVGVSVDGHALMLSAGTAPDAEQVAAGDAPVAAGCLAKLLTSTLVADAVAAGRIGWDDAVAGLLACDASSRQRLHGVTVRHLIDHAHGLDASMVAAVPGRADGFIDVDGLCGAMDSRSVHAPGRLYSYSHAGAWLAGALLEQLHGVRYGALLHAQQLIDERGLDEALVHCPATGASVALTVAQWLAFAQRSSLLLPSAEALAHPFALPGWHPSERSICRGWKHYGDGWFGHNANLTDRSAVLRINPRERVALVVSARETNGAVFAASGVFGDLLPEFRMLRPPRLLKPAEAAALPLQGHVGRYVVAKTAVDVSIDANGALQLCVHERSRDQAGAARRLRATEQGVFLAESGGHPEFLFVQFIAEAASSDSAYLWNGRQVLRKEAAAARA